MEKASEDKYGTGKNLVGGEDKKIEIWWKLGK
jgi:hypothetical protein